MADIKYPTKTQRVKGRIYLITNKVNGKKYIGQTINDIQERWSSHVRDSKRFSYPICQAIKKYGSDNFVIVELDRADTIEKLNELESFYIQRYGTQKPGGYNLDPGGGNFPRHPETRTKISLAKRGKATTTGRPCSEETKAKISKANKGRPSPRKGAKWSEETRIKVIAALKGRTYPKRTKPVSPETRAKLSVARKGKRGKLHTSEWRERMSESQKGNQWAKGKPFTEEHKQKLSEASRRRQRGPDGKFRKYDE